MKLVKEFFTWSKGERRAVLLLSILLLMLFSGDIFFNRINPFGTDSIHPDTLLLYKKLLLELEEDVTILHPEKKQKVNQKVFIEKNEKSKLKVFDPNNLDTQGWMSLGFTEKQAKSLLKYKASLGAFKSKEDVSNSYVVSEKKFEELKDFIQISKVINESEIKEKQKFEDFNKEEAQTEKLYLDLNSADSMQLLTLKGIGPFYAGKIIQYRKELGFYVKKEQLLEIWNFDPIKLGEIENNIWVDTTYILKVSINIDSSAVLKKHPYINWNIANAIVNYRKQHGQFTSIEALKKIVLINDSLFLKLQPYILID